MKVVHIILIVFIVLFLVIPVFSDSPRVVCFFGNSDEALNKCNAIAEECSIREDSGDSVVVCGITGKSSNQCNSNTDCGSGFLCNNGVCIETSLGCSIDLDCGEGMMCVNNNCEQKQDHKDDEIPQNNIPKNVAVSGGASSGGSGNSIIFDIKKDEETAKIELKVEKDSFDNIEKPKLNLNFNINNLDDIPPYINVKPENVINRMYKKIITFNVIAILLVLALIVKDLIIVHPRKY